MALWGTGGQDIPFSAAMKLMKWYPLLTLPMFIFMGYVLSESRLADDLYQHVPCLVRQRANGGLAMGTIGLMVLVSAMNGLVGGRHGPSVPRSPFRNCYGGNYGQAAWSLA